MNLLGGIVFRDPHQQVETALLRKMAKTAAPDRDPIAIGTGAVGLFTNGRISQLESDDLVLATHDLDLTNLKELTSFIGRSHNTGGLVGSLYKLEGMKFLSLLQGGFALALWDRRERQLLLAVDRFGIKQLHYVMDASKLAFASRIGALLGLPRPEQHGEPDAAIPYLSAEAPPPPGFARIPSSPYPGVRHLHPGEVLLFRDGYMRIETKIMIPPRRWRDRFHAKRREVSVSCPC